MKALTDKTLVPIGIAIVVIGGGSAWLTVLAGTVQESARVLFEIKTKQDLYSEDVATIRSDIRLIKYKLGVRDDRK